MTVAELIAVLQSLPQDLPVGYINECADDGSRFYEVCSAESGTSRQREYVDPSSIPTRYVMLS